MASYWNGYRWVEGPPFDMSDVKDALVDVELNPRTTTVEEVPVEVMVEQPTPNMIERHVDVLTRNPVHTIEDEPEIAIPRTATPPAGLRQLESVPMDAVSNLEKATREEASANLQKMLGDETVISDEVRARIRRELGMKDDGGAE